MELQQTTRPVLYSTDGLREALSLRSSNTVRSLVRRGAPHYRVGHIFRFDLDDVRTWLRNETDKVEGSTG